MCCLDWETFLFRRGSVGWSGLLRKWQKHEQSDYIFFRPTGGKTSCENTAETSTKKERGCRKFDQNGADIPLFTTWDCQLSAYACRLSAA